MDQAERPAAPQRASWGALVVGAVVLAALASIGVDDPRTGYVVALVALGVTLALLVRHGHLSRRRRREHEDALVAWSAERATQAERLRLARELHDLASHGLGLMTVRASAARAVSGPGAESEHSAALADIEQAGRAATVELRRMLGLLRGPDAEVAPRRPVDSLDTVGELVARARRAGVDATLTVAPGAAASSGGIQAAACAVIREALANVARHAGPTRVSITVEPAASGLRVVVDDEGPRAGWRPNPGAGLGLAGLRERVAVLGGSVQAGPRGAGYRLEAALPEVAA